jgi:hypothetical protein
MHISGLRPGEIGGYFGLERRFTVARKHLEDLLHNKIAAPTHHDGYKAALEDVAKQHPVIHQTAKRLVAPREGTHIEESAQAARLGMAIGSLVISCLPEEPRWQHTLRSAVKKALTPDEIMQLHEDAFDYLHEDKRPVLHEVAQGAFHAMIDPKSFNHNELPGIAQGTMALTIMAEDEVRFLNYVGGRGAEDLVYGIEQMLQNPPASD